MTNRLFGVLAFGAILLWASVGVAAESIKATQYPPLPFRSQYGGPFTLTTHTGEVVTNKYFSGKHFLLYFGYTQCADVCPIALHTIGNALRRMGPISDQVTPLFVNLDPKRTSLEDLKTYVRYFHPRFVGLTGTDAQIRAAANAYRVRYRSVIRDDGRREIVHSGKIFFVGPDGNVAAYFPHEAPPRMAGDSNGTTFETGGGPNDERDFARWIRPL